MDALPTHATKRLAQTNPTANSPERYRTEDHADQLNSSAGRCLRIVKLAQKAMKLGMTTEATDEKGNYTPHESPEEGTNRKKDTCLGDADL